MKTKEEIVANWLPRYTKRNLEDFGEYILLTNFNKYVEIFAEKFNVPILGKDANMISASAEGMTIINFGMIRIRGYAAAFCNRSRGGKPYCTGSRRSVRYGTEYLACHGLYS